jgi:predicted metal-dependent phosphoesterase TrpH
VNKETFYGKADLHIHSEASDGLNTIPEILDYVEHNTDLDLIAITDHDLMDGAYQARELAARGHYRFEVVMGVEITTLEGHLLALFVERPIRMLQSLDKTIRLIHQQGGLAIVSHPMSYLTRSIGRNGLLRVAQSKDPEVYFDAIEAFNPCLAGQVAHERAWALNREVLHLPEFGGSDAHVLRMIGQAYTLFPGRTAADFRRALEAQATQVGGEPMDWQAHRGLVDIAGAQLWQSLVVLPSRHIRRAIDTVLRA